MHHPVGKGAGLSVICVPLPVLGLGRGVFPGAAQGQDPAGHGRGRSFSILNFQLAPFVLCVMSTFATICKKTPNPARATARYFKQTKLGDALLRCN